MKKGGSMNQTATATENSSRQPMAAPRKVRFRDEVIEELDRICEQEDRSFNWLVRALVDEGLARRRK